MCRLPFALCINCKVMRVAQPGEMDPQNVFQAVEFLELFLVLVF